MKIREIDVKDYLSKSKLEGSDFVINPYVGCPHACKYCYACFMKRFTGHTEEWGKFVDVKRCAAPINKKKIEGKSVFLSSVTDCYNPLEKGFKVTRKILEQLTKIGCHVEITTKSALVLRDIDLFKKMKDVLVAFSINTLDEKFKDDMDRASSIEDRIKALKVLHENGIKTVLFMSPIFPKITDFKAIIERTKGIVDEYWFENLNLRGSYKPEILFYIQSSHPELKELYDEIYRKDNSSFWNDLAIEISSYCEKNKIAYRIFFHHNNSKDDN